MYIYILLFILKSENDNAIKIIYLATQPSQILLSMIAPAILLTDWRIFPPILVSERNPSSRLIDRHHSCVRKVTFVYDFREVFASYIT